MAKKFIELAVIRDDIRSVEADLVILKYASGFHGADAAVANDLTQSKSKDHSLENIAGQIEKDEYFITDTNHLIQAKKVLFIKMPPLPGIYYPQLRNFSHQALSLAIRYAEESKHIAMTIHGPGFGLDPSVAFLAQIAGLLATLATNSIPADLDGLSFVEHDFERFNLLSLLLRERFAQACYAKSSATGTIQYLDIEYLQSLYSPNYSQEAT